MERGYGVRHGAGMYRAACRDQQSVRGGRHCHYSVAAHSVTGYYHARGDREYRRQQNPSEPENQ